MEDRKVALVVGAQGVIGRNLVRHLEELGDWNVIGISRRASASSGRVRHISLDLLDANGLENALGDLSEVTHIFYTAYQDRPTWSELFANPLGCLSFAERRSRAAELMAPADTTTTSAE